MTCSEKRRYLILPPPLQVVLVELEEISPAQLATFPESVRHLRKKQGAVRWWKTRRRGPKCRTFFREAQDEEKSDKTPHRPSPDLSPSSRFWKEIRYHMPVRGKRAVYPEKTALLHHKWGCDIGASNTHTHTVNLRNLMDSKHDHGRCKCWQWLYVAEQMYFKMWKLWCVILNFYFHENVKQFCLMARWGKLNNRAEMKESVLFFCVPWCF